MNQKTLPNLIICLMLLVGISIGSTSSFATQNSAEIKQELDALEAEINKFKEMLKRTQSERSDLESTLENNEQNINEVLKRIQTIQKDINKGEDKLSGLSSQQRSLNEQKVEQQDRITQHIRAAYELGQQPYMKVLLNQEDPQKVERMMSYYRYINEARLKEIKTYETTIDQLSNLELLIAAQNETLLDQSVQLQAERTGLISIRSEKKQVLALLNSEINAAGDELDRKLEDRARLDELLTRISAGITNLIAQTDTRPFAEMRGSLVLPVHGKVTKSFGSRKTDGKLKWNGMIIAANEGEPVHAVHYGRVVFSDWLRGFGLLMIVSHGDGYMSLYGHNQVLYRETGDWIASGETIATVGNTGGQSDYGVYFEIRAAGKPFNPVLWCQARPAARAA